MKRIFYLVAASLACGIADAEARGWTRIAAARFATPEKDDVRVICRIADLHPLPGETVMIKGSDYDEGPADDYLKAAWLGLDDRPGQKAAFERFMTEGNGRWGE